jgi:hypothetical protein
MCNEYISYQHLKYFWLEIFGDVYFDGVTALGDDVKTGFSGKFFVSVQ